jgi:hypothetical protein
MSGRYQQLGQLDEATVGDNDLSFTGVDMRIDPVSLAPGMVAKAVNRVFRQGMVETRRGFTTPAWGKQFGIDFNWNFPISFTKAVSFGKVFGATTFADPVGQERQILACATKSWCITPNAPASVILYPPNVEVTEPVTFTQAFNALIMWRGPRANPLKLETRLNFMLPEIWEEVPDETNQDYTSTIPDAYRGLYYGNRVWVPFGNSKIAYSDVLSYTRYDADLSTVWVNEGESDVLMALAAYGENAIVCFKNRSIYYLMGVLPDPNVSGRLQVLTTQRGLVAPDAVTQVGRDLWFLSDDGVYAVTQVIETALQANSDPVSAPLAPIFERITWEAIGGAQAIYGDSKYFLALPVDGANHNNLIVVFDFLNGAWVGSWESAYMDVASFLRISINGHRRLAFVSGDKANPAQAGTLYVYLDGYTDERFGEEQEIETELITRGYHCQLPVDKIFLTAALELLTWHGAGEIDVIRDGVNEEARMLSFAKDRTKYNLFAKRSYDPANLSDNFLDPYRQDYSVQLLPTGISLGSGTVFGLHQASSERMRVRQDSRYVQLRLRGTRGRVNVRMASILAHADFIPMRSTI